MRDQEPPGEDITHSDDESDPGYAPHEDPEVFKDMRFVEEAEKVKRAEGETNAQWFDRVMDGITWDPETREEFREAMIGIKLDRHLAKERDAEARGLGDVLCDLGCECSKGLCRLRELGGDKAGITVTAFSAMRSRSKLIQGDMKKRVWVCILTTEYMSLSFTLRKEIEDHVRSCHGPDAVVGLGKNPFTRGSDKTSRNRVVAFASPDPDAVVRHTTRCRLHRLSSPAT